MPMFSHQHYQMLAQLMQDAKRQDDVDQQGGLDMLERMLADMLERDNYAFRRSLFLAACQPGANVAARTKQGALKLVTEPRDGTNPGLRRQARDFGRSKRAED